MKIGENGIIVFKMYDLDMTTVNKLIFTFRGVEKIEKEYPSEYVNYADNRFYVGLTQEDTVILSRNRRVKVQAEAQICYTNGAVAKSEIISFVLGETLNTTIIPGNSPSDFVDDIEFHYENGIIIIGGSGMTEERVREIIAGYHFATESELENYVTLSSLNTRLNDYVTKNGLNDAIATYIDENVDLTQYATKTEVTENLATKQDKMQFSTMPTASEELLGKIYQYTGVTNVNFTNGLFYECVEVTPSTTPKTYTWVAKATDVVVDTTLDPTSDNPLANSTICAAFESVVTHYETLPTASADYYKQIVQYTGTTTNGLVHANFYECISDGGEPATYSWVRVDVQELQYVSPEMFGAKADGLTDDSDALKSAIATAYANNVPVSLSQKTYVINTLSFAKTTGTYVFYSGVSLIGNKTTFIINDGNGTTPNVINNVNNITISGITFSGYKPLKFTKCKNLLIENCKFIDIPLFALLIQWSDHPIVRNNVFKNIGASLTRTSFNDSTFHGTSGKAVQIQGRTTSSDDSQYCGDVVVANNDISEIYGGKAVSFIEEIHGIRCLNNLIHTTTYGGVEFYRWNTDEDDYNIFDGNKLYDMGANPVAEGDEIGNLGIIDGDVNQGGGVGANGIFFQKGTHYGNLIVTNNVFERMMENAIEGPFKEVAYNIVNMTGVGSSETVRWTQSTEGMYLTGNNQCVHHNQVKNCKEIGIAYSVAAEPATNPAQKINISNNTFLNNGEEDIRAQRKKIISLVIEGNSTQNGVRLITDNVIDYLVYRQPQMFITPSKLRFVDGVIETESVSSDDSWMKGWNTPLLSDELHPIYLNKRTGTADEMTQYMFRNIPETEATSVMYAIVDVTYSFNNCLGTGEVLQINVGTDSNYKNRVSINGIYASASDIPSEKEYFTRHYVVIADSNTSSKLNILVRNLCTNSDGLLEIASINVRVI